eukprot:COSAG02_NODE_49455_length_326_cov_2.039648_1_plen_28_part_01
MLWTNKQQRQHRVRLVQPRAVAVERVPF